MAKIDHIAICVREIEAALPLYRDGLGLDLERIEELPDRGVRVAFLRAGSVRIELVQPVRSDSEVSRFLDRHGEGLHHISMAVSNLEAGLAQAVEGGSRVLPDPGKCGAHGRRVAFLHPKSTSGVLIEIVEDRRASESGGMSAVRETRMPFRTP
jgi:methylmalonyl-CoA/ethylmalonyl-CoA epimerase